MTEIDQLVEKVARAILLAHDWTIDNGNHDSWEQVDPDWQEAYRNMARAATRATLEAIREPITHHALAINTVVWIDRLIKELNNDE